MERLRQRDDITSSKIVGYCYYKPSKIYTGRYDYKVVDHAGDAQMVRDLVPPRFRDFNPDYPVVNPVSMVKTSMVPSKHDDVEYLAEDGTAKYYLRGSNLGSTSIYRTTGAIHPPLGQSFSSIDTAMASYLYQRALSRASSAEFDFGVTVGEVAETAAFLAKPLQSLVSLSRKAFAGISSVRNLGGKTTVRIYKNASKRQIRRILENSHAANPLQPALRVLDESANHWLAYKFGVLPILDDIAKLTQFKQDNIKRLLGVRYARVKGRKSDTTTSQINNATNWNYFRSDVFKTKRVEDRHYFGLYFKNQITDPLVNFMEGLGFAPFNVFSLAYELIPLSFVVDRFIDIKSFIKGNLGGMTKEFLSYYVSRKTLTTITSSHSNVWFGYPTKLKCKVSQDLHAGCTYSQLTRVVNLDRPTFPVINPLWREQLIADATNLSLIWGRLRTFVGK